MLIVTVTLRGDGGSVRKTHQPQDVRRPDEGLGFVYGLWGPSPVVLLYSTPIESSGGLMEWRHCWLRVPPLPWLSCVNAGRYRKTITATASHHFNLGRKGLGGGPVGHPPTQGCIRREGTSEAAREAVR